MDYTQLLYFSIPSIVSVGLCIYFFHSHNKNEENRRAFLLSKSYNKITLPTRLQAYERLTIFLDRINIDKLIKRVPPTASNKQSYLKLLIENIEQEYNHNIAQQIYISEKCWEVINISKFRTIQELTTICMDESIETVKEYLEEIIKMEQQTLKSAIS